MSYAGYTLSFLDTDGARNVVAQSSLDGTVDLYVRANDPDIFLGDNTTQAFEMTPGFDYKISVSDPPKLFASTTSTSTVTLSVLRYAKV